jgi:aquaporin Z
MSMNPARTFASAVVAGEWRDIWLYFVAPPLGMLAAAEAYVRLRGLPRVYCAKLRHGRGARCIFNCNYGALGEGA